MVDRYRYFAFRRSQAHILTFHCCVTSIRFPVLYFDYAHLRLFFAAEHLKKQVVFSLERNIISIVLKYYRLVVDKMQIYCSISYRSR
jgi:hypothetical protein